MYEQFSIEKLWPSIAANYGTYYIEFITGL